MKKRQKRDLIKIIKKILIFATEKGKCFIIYIYDKQLKF